MENNNNILQVTKVTEVQQLLRDKSQVVLVFTAEWLGSSHILELFIKDFMDDYKEDIVFCKIEKAKKTQSIFDFYGVQQLPSMIFIQKGEVMNQMSGMKGRNVIRKNLESFINKSNNASM